ncbi:uncharacterized protein LOC124639542 [Helicoverpa zea]|uniref:uncharacterized protein LOC124639542 n=1 Tax=Helicoverpa zea TaxID=7113 RepID=UPI001F562362|nr:uncharacterized protein LOC124639542 [Helicoverpa zea]
MDVVQLIKLVKKHEFLYNQNHPSYRNTDLKNSTWELIGREMNECREACRLKWKTVRDGYIKYKKLSQMKNSKVSNYVWSTQLKFLDNYSYRIKGMSKSMSEQSEGSQTAAQEVSPVQSPSPPPLVPLRSVPSTEANSPMQTDEELQSVIERNSSQLEKFKQIDSTDLLFLSYSGTFKKFSARQQALMKIELAKLFANAELEQLQAGQHSSQINDDDYSTLVVKAEFDDE